VRNAALAWRAKIDCGQMRGHAGVACAFGYKGSSAAVDRLGLLVAPVAEIGEELLNLCSDLLCGGNAGCGGGRAGS
jgi:hypothetical protein